MKKLSLIIITFLFLAGCEKEKIITKEQFLADEDLLIEWSYKCADKYVPEQTCDNARAAEWETIRERHRETAKKYSTD